MPVPLLGVGDGTDLRGVGFQRGRYVASELEGILTGDHIRAQRILEAAASGFSTRRPCARWDSASECSTPRFMADQFNRLACPLWRSTDGDRHGDPGRPLTARRGELRPSSRSTFQRGDRMPEVDTILLSAHGERTVSCSSLDADFDGRRSKSVLTVLDFIGQAHADYRFDIRYRALIGGTRRQVERAVATGFPLMPPGCAVRLDEIAQSIVLENLRASIKSTVGRLSTISRDAQHHDVGAVPGASSFDLPDVLRPARGTTFTSARRAAVTSVRRPAARARHEQALGRMLHVDDEERYQCGVLGSWPTLHRHLPADLREERLQWMLFAVLGFRQRPVPRPRRRSRGSGVAG